MIWSSGACLYSQLLGKRDQEDHSSMPAWANRKILSQQTSLRIEIEGSSSTAGPRQKSSLKSNLSKKKKEGEGRA
jgi:hypothetical protein